MHPLGLAIKRFFTPTFKIPFTTTKGDIDDENEEEDEDDEGNDVQI